MESPFSGSTLFLVECTHPAKAVAPSWLQGSEGRARRPPGPALPRRRGRHVSTRRHPFRPSKAETSTIGCMTGMYSILCGVRICSTDVSGTEVFLRPTLQHGPAPTTTPHCVKPQKTCSQAREQSGTPAADLTTNTSLVQSYTPTYAWFGDGTSRSSI